MFISSCLNLLAVHMCKVASHRSPWGFSCTHLEEDPGKYCHLSCLSVLSLSRHKFLWLVYLALLLLPQNIGLPGFDCLLNLTLDLLSIMSLLSIWLSLVNHGNDLGYLPWQLHSPWLAFTGNGRLLKFSNLSLPIIQSLAFGYSAKCSLGFTFATHVCKPLKLR